MKWKLALSAVIIVGAILLAFQVRFYKRTIRSLETNINLKVQEIESKAQEIEEISALNDKSHLDNLKKMWSFFRRLPICSDSKDLRNRSFDPKFPFFFESGVPINKYFLKNYSKSKVYLPINFPEGIRFSPSSGELYGKIDSERPLSQASLFSYDKSKNCVEVQNLYFGVYESGTTRPDLDRLYELVDVFGGKHGFQTEYFLPYGSDIYEKEGEGGYYLLTDCVVNNISKFDFNGNLLETFFNNGGGNRSDQFNTPADIKVLDDETIYVVEERNHRVQVLNKDGKFLNSFGAFGKAGGDSRVDSGYFNNPLGVVKLSTGEIVVSDYGNDRMQVFSEDHKFIRKFGKQGCGPGEFWGPYYLEKDSKDRIYIVDRSNNRIQVMDAKGNFIASFGGGEDCKASDKKDRLGHPHEIAIGGDDFIYVADSKNGRIQIYDQNFQHKHSLGSHRFFYFPKTIAVDRRGDLFVSDVGKEVLISKWRKLEEPRKDIPSADPIEKVTDEVKISSKNKIYSKYCSRCHDTGVAGAPLLKDASSWKGRFGVSNNELLKAVVRGKGIMPPRGGCTECSDSDLIEVISFIKAEVNKE